MKKTFVTSWNKSTQARKQRKYRANAPLHTKGTFLHANLSKDLREKHGRRSLRVRKGDEVEVLRGTFRGDKGVVEQVDLKTAKILVRGVEAVKRDGSKRQVPLSASNVRITKITDDKRRL